MIRIAALSLALALTAPASANDLAKDLAPTGTLRATYISTNPPASNPRPAPSHGGSSSGAETE